MKSPYSNQPSHKRWSRAISEVAHSDIDPTTDSSFSIDQNTKVATAGSCFAQHISRHLMSIGVSPLVTERAHPEVASQSSKFHYGLYSARYGNIYTAKQMLQLLLRAYGEFCPTEPYWRSGEGALIDPFRPLIPFGFTTEAELEYDRKQHFSAVRTMFETLDVLVFTLGLTESWVSKTDGSVFPSCPGTFAGEWNPDLYKFHNQTIIEIVDDLNEFILRLRNINKSAKVMLTVSPVPLVATATRHHVLVANTYSKSVLRVAAQTVSESHSSVDYFPSYEIITNPRTSGIYYAADGREVTETGVKHVMRIFEKRYVSSKINDPQSETSDKDIISSETKKANEQMNIICDEIYNDI